jgi:hypothetical protein
MCKIGYIAYFLLFAAVIHRIIIFAVPLKSESASMQWNQSIDSQHSNRDYIPLFRPSRVRHKRRLALGMPNLLWMKTPPSEMYAPKSEQSSKWIIGKYFYVKNV